MAFYADTSASGTPLVLIHSVNAAPSAFEMKPLFEKLRSTRPVFAPDLPGFGASDRADRKYTAKFFAESLCHFIEAAVGGKADVVALSLSCEFAAQAASLAPQLFRSLTLISPTGFGDRAPLNETTRDRIISVMRTPGLGALLFRLLTTKPSIRYFLNMNFNDRAPDDMVQYATRSAHRKGARYAPIAFLSGTLFATDAPATLYAPLELPALILYDQDPNVSFARLPQFIAENANWQALRVAPTQGLPHFEQTTEVVAILQRFWATDS